jgi:hypothetical protein
MSYTYTISSEKSMLKLGEALARACIATAVSKCVHYC